MLDGRMILYVEDDPLSREVMQIVVGSVIGGGELVTFEDSSNFIPRLRALPRLPDLILLDIHMTPLDGFELLAVLQAESTLSSIPVVAFTASIFGDEVRQIRDAGFDGALAKPLNMETFPALLMGLLRGESIWQVE